jgi:long-subunit fatty acid transport protein
MRIPLHYPPMYKGGIRFLDGDQFDIEFDAAYIPWTMLPYYDVRFEKGQIIKNFKYPLQWQNTWNYRLGGSYRINQHWELSAGYAFEQSATPPKLAGTEATRHFIAGGFRMSYFGMDFDLGYTHIFQDDVETPIPPPSFASVLDDGRGRYKSSYDVFIGAVNFNIERMYKAFHNGQAPW